MTEIGFLFILAVQNSKNKLMYMFHLDSRVQNISISNKKFVQFYKNLNKLCTNINKVSE